MENYLDRGLLPSFAGSCTEISRSFFISGIPLFVYSVAESFTPAAPFKESEWKSVFIHWEKLGKRITLFPERGSIQQELTRFVRSFHLPCNPSWALCISNRDMHWFQDKKIPKYIHRAEMYLDLKYVLDFHHTLPWGLLTSLFCPFAATNTFPVAVVSGEMLKSTNSHSVGSICLVWACKMDFLSNPYINS